MDEKETVDLQEQPTEKEKEKPVGDPSKRYMFYIVAGGYLVYLAIKILSGVLPEVSDGWTGSRIGLVCASGAFLIFGVGLAVIAIRALLKKQSGTNQTEETDNG